MLADMMPSLMIMSMMSKSPIQTMKPASNIQSKVIHMTLNGNKTSDAQALRANYINNYPIISLRSTQWTSYGGLITSSSLLEGTAVIRHPQTRYEVSRLAVKGWMVRTSIKLYTV